MPKDQISSDDLREGETPSPQAKNDFKQDFPPRNKEEANHESDQKTKADVAVRNEKIFQNPLMKGAKSFSVNTNTSQAKSAAPSEEKQNHRMKKP